ncbi:MAG: right-handed parallel beta-helix repeat-containing protein [Armatimonadetes bacterium]|nr:right-handed parallel beta-helix repeat-containing protein [Armatimonadota bacterium]
MRIVLLALLTTATAAPAFDVGSPPAGERWFHVAGADPRAADTNDGSAEHPWKTIARATEALQPGDTVWLHGGVYRETVKVEKSGTAEHRIAYRAVPGERVVVKGADELRGWSHAPQSPVWETTWTCPWAYPSLIACDEQPLLPLWVPAGTEEMKPPKAYCQYFVGFGRGREAMFPGSFWYDEPNKRLLVWLKGDADPNQHLMEGAVRAAWGSSGSWLRVEGIHFMYAPLVVPVGGIVFVMAGPGGGMAAADGCIVRDCEVSLGAFEGMYVRGGESATTLVENCWVHHNGNGIGGFEGKGLPDNDAWLVVRRCRLTDSNLFNWNPNWHCGGKHMGRRTLFDQCEFARNYRAPGCWFDIHTRDCIVNRCYAHHNGTFGLYYEIGETGAFINNTIEGAPNCAAIALFGSSRTLVAQNLVVASERGILVGGEGKVDGKADRITCHNGVYNNVLVGTSYPLLRVTPDSDLAVGNASDYNMVWQTKPPAAPGGPFESIDRGPAGLSLETWEKERRLDRHSIVEDPLLIRSPVGRPLGYAEGTLVRSVGQNLSEEFLSGFFAAKPQPEIQSETGSSSVKDPQPPSAAFVAKVAELVYAARNREQIGPLPLPAAAAPVPIAVANGGFEAAQLALNAVAGDVPGWVEHEDGPAGARVWHANGTGLWNWYPPSGDNVLVLDGPAAVSVEQALAARAEPGARYEVSVWAGQRIDQEKQPWPRVTLTLRAGDKTLGEVVLPEPLIAPHHGVYVEMVLSVHAPEAARGLPLRISIRREPGGGAQVAIDEVTVAKAPE